MVWSWENKVLDFDSSSNAGKNEASYIIASGALDGTGRPITFEGSAIDISILLSYRSCFCSRYGALNLQMSKFGD
ncbi:uncharacterized protein EAF02_001814 [Botrytis sinoallii]|uniref:uncharacterized protein n=1 Tax=Botrytis sinoallii TaxID=1463999 RepID=UPI0019014964|nr:uncharacterized protein EAF02_001814 [Botrytis sinoallii]KAF7891489.1 hypothetical protein EAF02_001814 [Botrytis sinoallii]